jgi:hypothetical protein
MHTTMQCFKNAQAFVAIADYYARKMFIELAPVFYYKPLSLSSLMLRINKLERLSSEIIVARQRLVC